MRAKTEAIQRWQCLCKQYSFTFLIPGEHERGFPYQWGCDKCGRQYKFTAFEAGEIVYKELPPKNERWVVLLRHEQSKLFMIHLNPYWKVGRPYAEEAEHQTYYYNEHTCPTNWIRGIEAVIFEGDQDPHGVFHFVRAVRVQDNPALVEYFEGERAGESDLEPDWSEIFPEVIGQGQVIDSSVDAFVEMIVHDITAAPIKGPSLLIPPEFSAAIALQDARDAVVHELINGHVEPEFVESLTIDIHDALKVTVTADEVRRLRALAAAGETTFTVNAVQDDLPIMFNAYLKELTDRKLT
jgi:hypothetical protein